MSQETGRITKISRDDDGNALGTAVYLSNEQLRKLGIDVESTDQVEFRIVDGQIIAVPDDG